MHQKELSLVHENQKPELKHGSTKPEKKNLLLANVDKVFQEERDGLIHEIRKLESRLHKEIALRKDLVISQQNLNDQMKDERHNVKGRETEFKLLNSQMKSLQMELVDSKSSYEESTDQNAWLRNQLKERENDFRMKLADVRFEGDRIELKYQDAMVARAELQQQNLKLENTIRRLESDLHYSVSELSTFQESNDLSTLKAHQADNQLVVIRKRFISEISRLQTELQGSNDERQSLSRTVDSVKFKLDAANHENQKYKSHTSSLERSLAATETENVNMKSSLAVMEDQLVRLRKQHEVITDQASKTDKQLIMFRDEKNQAVRDRLIGEQQLHKVEAAFNAVKFVTTELFMSQRKKVLGGGPRSSAAIELLAHGAEGLLDVEKQFEAMRNVIQKQEFENNNLQERVLMAVNEMEDVKIHLEQKHQLDKNTIKHEHARLTNSLHLECERIKRVLILAHESHFQELKRFNDTYQMAIEDTLGHADRYENEIEDILASSAYEIQTLGQQLAIQAETIHELSL